MFGLMEGGGKSNRLLYIMVVDIFFFFLFLFLFHLEHGVIRLFVYLFFFFFPFFFLCCLHTYITYIARVANVSVVYDRLGVCWSREISIKNHGHELNL